MRRQSRRSGLLLLAAAAAALGLAGGLAYATTPLQVVSVDLGVGGYRPGVDYRVSGYRPRPVPANLLESPSISLNDPSRLIDKQGVALTRYKGRMIYHPLTIAWYGSGLLTSYLKTRNPAYLDRVMANANFLVNTAISRNGALYFPYRFTYALFGNHADLIRAPWPSALAQGAALDLFVQLNEVTGDQHWRTAADATFATFVQRRSARLPWIVFIPRWNHRHYLWFEEYPKNPPVQPFNGHMYALVGVYRYALVTGSAAAAAVFDGGATTVRHHADRFRVRGEISYYSVRVHAQYSHYHCAHIELLRLLARLTGDPWFARESQRFRADGRHAHVHC
jgi:hypothetical protein